MIYLLYLSFSLYAVVNLRGNRDGDCFRYKTCGGNKWTRTSTKLLMWVRRLFPSTCVLWWEQVDSNHRPHAYQACALTSWAMFTYLILLVVYGSRLFCLMQIGGGKRDRTADPLLARQVLSQLSYTPKKIRSTPDFRKQMPRQTEHNSIKNE